MAVAAGTVSVSSDKAYLIVPAPSATTIGGPNRPGLKTTITNLGSQVVYLGPAGVTGQANGYQLGVGTGNEATVTLDLAYTDALYGIAAGGTQSVTWLQGWQ